MALQIFRPRVFLALLAPLAFLFGCTSPDGDGTGMSGCLPGCTGSRSYDVQSYVLRSSFDWNAQRLVASEDISLLKSDPMAAVIELDAAVEVRRVYAGETALPWALDMKNRKLRVDLSALSAAGLVSFTVDYEAPTAISLIATMGQDGDPLSSRVVYTNSEPDLGVYWLVGKHLPADRARFAVELTVAADEDVIANGARVADVLTQSGRRVRYEIDKPIPTYQMAFAAGQLEHYDRTGGRVPLSVWHRRGLVFEPGAMLDALTDAMATFERLLGPYPWDRYSVVAAAAAFWRWHGERHRYLPGRNYRAGEHQLHIARA